MHKSILKLINKPAVKIAVSVLILICLLLWLPTHELLETLKKISFRSWFFVFAGFIAGHMLGAIKWRLLINMGKKPLPLLVCIKCYFAGLFANLFLPSLAGGDIVKMGLAIRYNKEKDTTIFGTLLDRIIDTAAVVFIIIVAALLSPQFLQPQDQKIVYSIIGVFLLMILLVILFTSIPADRIGNKKIKDLVSRARKILRIVYDQPARPILAFVFSMCIQVSFILLTVYLAFLSEIYIPIAFWFLVWPLAKLSALLPISLGGIGVREVALAALLSRLSIPVAESVALGLLWESVLIFGGLFGGAIYLILQKFTQPGKSLNFKIPKTK